MGILPACMSCLCTTCIQEPEEPDSCELPCCCWESNRASLQMQQRLLSFLSSPKTGDVPPVETGFCESIRVSPAYSLSLMQVRCLTCLVATWMIQA